MEISLCFHYDYLTQEKLKQYIEKYLETNDLNEYTIIPYANQFAALRIYTKQDISEHIQQTFQQQLPFVYGLSVYTSEGTT